MLSLLFCYYGYTVLTLLSRCPLFVHGSQCPLPCSGISASTFLWSFPYITNSLYFAWVLLHSNVFCTWKPWPSKMPFSLCRLLLCITPAFLFTAGLIGSDVFPTLRSTLPVLSWTIADHSLILSPSRHHSYQSHRRPRSACNSFLVILVTLSAALDKTYCFVLFKLVLQGHPVPLL